MKICQGSIIWLSCASLRNKKGKRWMRWYASVFKSTFFGRKRTDDVYITFLKHNFTIARIKWDTNWLAYNFNFRRLTLNLEISIFFLPTREYLMWKRDTLWMSHVYSYKWFYTLWKVERIIPHFGEKLKSFVLIFWSLLLPKIETARY